MDLKNAATDAWQDLRTGFEHASNESEADVNAILLHLTGKNH
jgi:hypothetical protein